MKKSKQLAEPQYAGRRYADTSVLLSEFSTWPLDSERSSLALARINYLHSRYPEILPSDTLYTLLLFATQPAEFAARLEWRALTPLELAAQWKYWYEVGQRMGIPADTIPKTFEGMTAWYKKYEEEFMVPDDTNHYVAVQTQTLLLYWVPTELGRWFGSQAVLALLDDRLRIAMKFPLPTWWVPLVVSATFTVRRWFIKHLRLPRIDKDRFLRVNKDRDSKTGRYHLKVYDNEPWYAEQTFANRWGPWGILARLAGKPVAGDKGFREDGYEIETVGPVMFENTGVEKVRQAAEDMRKAHAGGGGTCPFAI